MKSHRHTHVLNNNLRWKGCVRWHPERREGLSIDLDRARCRRLSLPRCRRLSFPRCRRLSLARLGDNWGKLTKRELGETWLRGNPPKETTSHHHTTHTWPPSRWRQRLDHHIFVVYSEKRIQRGLYSSQTAKHTDGMEGVWCSDASKDVCRDNTDYADAGDWYGSWESGNRDFSLHSDDTPTHYSDHLN